jgi:lysophospholipase L1-like esterase
LEVQPRNNTVLIVGDSITLGAVEVGLKGIVRYVTSSYIEKLRRKLPRIAFDIDARIHRTTTQAVEVIDELLEQYCPAVTLLMIGGNDADIDWRRFVVSEGKMIRHGTALSRFEANLAILVNKIREAGSQPILTDFPKQNIAIRQIVLSKLAGRDLAPLMASHGGQKVSDNVYQEYYAAVQRVAIQTQCDMICFGRDLMQFPADEVFGTDGVHPNDRGHSVIADAVIPAIKNTLNSLQGFSREFSQKVI